MSIQPNIEPMLYDIYEVALALRLGASTVRKLVSAGEIPSIRIGNRRLIRVEDLRAFIAASASWQPEPQPASPA
jgi:excisionase family DNA binding protein